MSALQALAEGVPWWGVALIALPGPLAYIYRLHCVFRLAAKALDKAEHDDVAAIMGTVTGHPVTPSSCPPSPSAKEGPGLGFVSPEAK